MKKQQRAFVVEIKSAGRRSVARQGSIWGSTDLKAFVRQAEGDAPQLFKPSGKPDGAIKGVANSPDGEVLQQSGDAHRVEASVSEPVLDHSPQSEALNVIPIPAIVPVAVSTDVSKPKRNKPAGRRAHRATGADAAATIATPAEKPIDELVALDAENRRLKALLVEHIRRQNRQLREMLGRFDG